MNKKNLIFNFVGQGWTAIMGIIFIPFYIKYLGIELYGLVGFFAILQAWFLLIDMGMRPTLSREMAFYSGGSHTDKSIRDLLRSIEIIAIFIAFLITSIIALSANWISSSWLQAGTVQLETITRSLLIMSLVIGIRLIEGIYTSSLLGMQKHFAFNVVQSLMATIRGFGAVIVLKWISPTIEAFFIWQAIISFVTLIIFILVTYYFLPNINRFARFSLNALKSVSNFMAGMTLATILKVILTQIDKILLSSLLLLSDFGYYTLAATVAAVIGVLIAPITQTVYPQFCEFKAKNKTDEFKSLYHQSSQLVTVVTGSIALVVIFFPENFLRLWTQDAELALIVSPLLALLMIGNLLNSFMWLPYQAQLAYGWTSLNIKINAVAIILLIPLLLYITPIYGAYGAAFVWILLNCFYILLGVHLMHKKILKDEKWKWYFNDIFLPSIITTIVLVLLKILYGYFNFNENFEDFLVLALAIILSFITMLLMASSLRPVIFQLIKNKTL